MNYKNTTKVNDNMFFCNEIVNIPCHVRNETFTYMYKYCTQCVNHQCFSLLQTCIMVAPLDSLHVYCHVVQDRTGRRSYTQVC